MAGWWKNFKSNEKNVTQSLDSSNNMFTKENFSALFEEFNPKNYEDVEEIANALILHKSVKLNLKDTVISDRRRIVDFLFGIAYVLNFVVKKIDIDVYEFKPKK